MERLLTYDRLIAYHRNKLDVSPFPDDKLNIAYKNNKFSQFLIHLKNDDIDLIKKTLKEIYSDLQSGDEVYKYSILNPQLLDRVFDFLFEEHIPSDDSEEKEEVCFIASLCFKQFCLVLKIKEYLDEGRYIKSVIRTFEDESERVKLNIYQGLIYYSQSRYGIDTLLRNEILEKLIKKLNEEKSYKVLNLILEITNEILNSESAPQISLRCGFIKILKFYLNSPRNEPEKEKLKENVLINFGSLSLCEEGKRDCVEDGDLIKIIISFLKNDIDSSPILIYSTRFLNNVSILKRGKVEIFENDGLETCMTILDKFTDDQLILNILQIIANVAEEPRGRKKMCENLHRLEKYSQSDDSFIKSQTKITKDIILWKP
jgi:hypothetical protein